VYIETDSFSVIEAEIQKNKDFAYCLEVEIQRASDGSYSATILADCVEPASEGCLS
jgi:hypothetical protein